MPANPADFTRVRLNDTGAHVTVRVVRDGMTELKEDAVDKSGRPLPDAPAPAKKAAKKTSAAKTAATKKTATAPAAAPTSGGDAAEVS